MSDYVKFGSCWLIGTGQMAVDYTAVLKSMGIIPIVIGRGEESAELFKSKTGILPNLGGIEGYLKLNPKIPSYAIVAVSVESLFSVVDALIDYGAKYILVEKPGSLNLEELLTIYKKSIEKKSSVYIAYNRRYYQSVAEAIKNVELDGGLLSFTFEFTEWSHKIEKLTKAPGVKEQWFLVNSTHVIDLAFYIGGKPKEMSSFSSGSLSWHPAGSLFFGAGVTERGALFSYSSNWQSAGRWKIELHTAKRKLILEPLEELKEQLVGQLEVHNISLPNEIDQIYKPGLFRQTSDYINNFNLAIPSIAEHIENYSVYRKINDKLK